MNKTIPLALVLLFCLSCGSTGDSNIKETSSDNIIKNTIKENVTPVGLSTFALGVSPKFPLEDSQTQEGIGYKSVARVVRHIATNELFTFPETPNHQQIIDTVKFFIDNGHQVTHEIHILNGPSMRKCRDPWINEITGKETCDEEFVDRLQYDPMVRDAVLNLFAQAVEHARQLEKLGATVLICPELEDNQSHKTFNILLTLLNQVGWSDPTKTVRNGGYPGEFGSVRYETHNDLEIENLRPGDIVNNDGNSFVFSDESPSNGELSEARIRYMLEKSEQLGVIAFLWNARLQGNVQVSPGNFQPYPSYTDRTYVLKRPDSQAAILLGISKEEIIVNNLQ